MISITMVDMQIRDERVLSYIQRRLANADDQITYDEIAEAFGCHRNTASAIVLRLERGGFIQVDRSAMRGGYRYSLGANR